MGDKAKYHHLIPQTYMSAWANSSGTLLYKDLYTGKQDKRNKENMFGINHYHSIIAGMPICTEDDAKTIFAPLREYRIFFNGDELSKTLDFNRFYSEFDNWEITRKVDGSVAAKRPIKAAIDQIRIRDIESLWSIKYENYWPEIRDEIEDKVLKLNGEIAEFQKEFLMRFYVSMDWRSIATDPLFEEKFQWLCKEILPLDEINIPKDERELPFFETAADYFRHCLLLKMFRSFFNEDGPIYLQAIQSLKYTSFHFLVADGISCFETSDNPSFVHIGEDGNKVGLMPITPHILLAQGKNMNDEAVYYVTHITEDAVKRYNRIIEQNADQYVIINNVEK